MTPSDVGHPAGAGRLEHEEERLSALDGFRVLDTPQEETFDRLTRLTARFLDAPISLISLIDRERQWFKSCFGWDQRETSRGISFCTHVVSAGDLLIVPDATLDPRFSTNPLVTGDHHIRAYAGAPLRSRDGFVLGALCVLDIAPRSFSKLEIDTLTELAAVVVDELELRLAVVRRRKAEERVTAALEEAKEASAARDRFMSSMSHELRTPLNAILGFTQLLLIKELSQDQKDDLREIDVAARSLLDMINELFAADLPKRSS